MKYFIGQVLLIILTFILQTTIILKISIADVVPNLIIILVSVYGFSKGENSGMITGFIAGLLCDIFFGPILGFHALLLIFLGYANGKITKLYYPDYLIYPFLMVGLSSFTYNFVYYVCMFLLRSRFEFEIYLKEIIIPEFLYTLIISIIFVPFILRWNSLFSRRWLREKEEDV